MNIRNSLIFILFFLFSFQIVNAGYDFRIWTKGPTFYTIGKPTLINVYIQNNGTENDTYIINFSKQATYLGNDVSHLIMIKMPSNKISLLKPNEIGNTFATITLVGPISSGSITFNATSGYDPNIKRVAESIQIDVEFPITLPEFKLLGFLLILILSISIIFYSSHFR